MDNALTIIACVLAYLAFGCGAVALSICLGFVDVTDENRRQNEAMILLGLFCVGWPLYTFFVLFWASGRVASWLAAKCRAYWQKT